VGIDYNNRLLAVAPTRGGKSELLNVLASGLRSQWALIDNKDEFTVPDVEKVRDVDALDWQNERILHWVPGHDHEQWEAFFARAFELPGGRFTAVVHEVGASCDYKAGRVGPRHTTYVGQGEARGLGYWAASTRPVCLPTFAISEAAHVFAFAEPMTRADDHSALATAMNMRPDQLRDAQTNVLAQLGHRGFIWAQRREGRVSSWRPLPDDMRAQNIVQRTTVE
jgi:hypothetical protein